MAAMRTNSATAEQCPDGSEFDTAVTSPAPSAAHAPVHAEAHAAASGQGAALDNALINALAEGVLIVTPAFIIESASGPACRIFGYEPEQMQGKPVGDLVPDSLRHEYQEDIEQYFRTGQSSLIGGRPTLSPGLSKHGEILQTEWSVVETRLGDQPRLIIVVRDVTERRRLNIDLRKIDARFRVAFESAPIGMAMVSTEGRWMRVNQSICSMLGYSPEELTAMSTLDVTHPNDLPVCQDCLRQLLGGDLRTCAPELRYVRKDGHIVWVQLNMALVRDDFNGPMYLIAQIQDITERRNLDRLKSGFLAMVTHELRTPVTSIRGALGLLLGDARTSLPPQTRSLIELAHRNCDRLNRLIRDILDIEKIESGKLDYHMDVVDISELLERAAQELRPYAQQHGVAVEVSETQQALTVEGDFDRLMQVMANLVSNAAKFSPAGQTVTIRSCPDGQRVRISVTDRGRGIPEEFHRLIFQKFAQANAGGTDRRGGSGLGLNISKAIIEKHGGSIGFETAAGQGTTFFFHLPLPAQTAG